MKNRIGWIVNCKALAIMLVSFGHILGSVDGNATTHFLYMVCCAFELPLFFMLSGVQLSLKKQERSISDYARKNIINIGYPYFTFSILYILFGMMVQLLKLLYGHSIDYKLIVYDLIDAVTLWGIGALWFLPVLIIAIILFYITIKTNENRYWIPALFISLLGVVLQKFCVNDDLNYTVHTASIMSFAICYVARILVAYSFVFVGYVVGPFIMKLEKGSNIKNVGIAIPIVILCLFLCQLNQKIVDLHFGYVRNPLITYSLAVMMLISISVLLRKENGLVSFIGENTLLIMGLQILTGYIARGVSKFYQFIFHSISPNIVAVISMLVFFALMIMCVLFINKYIPFIFRFPSRDSLKNN